MKGVFKIQNPDTKKAYIDASIDVKRKMKVHQTLLSQNKHPNPRLQKDWISQGGTNGFKVYLLAKVILEQDLPIKKKTWINIFSSVDRRLLYNRYDKHHSHYQKDVSLLEENDEGKYIEVETFPSVTFAALFFDVSKPAITDACRHNARMVTRRIKKRIVLYREDYLRNYFKTTFKIKKRIKDIPITSNFSIKRTLNITKKKG